MFEQRFSMFFYEKLVYNLLVPYATGMCTKKSLITEDPKTVLLGSKQRAYIYNMLLCRPTLDRYTVREMGFKQNNSIIYCS